jgi:hypothetical protein
MVLRFSFLKFKVFEQIKQIKTIQKRSKALTFHCFDRRQQPISLLIETQMRPEIEQ